MSQSDDLDAMRWQFNVFSPTKGYPIPVTSVVAGCDIPTLVHSCGSKRLKIIDQIFGHQQEIAARGARRARTCLQIGANEIHLAIRVVCVECVA